MTYTLIVGTKSYDLPKKTLAIVESWTEWWLLTKTRE